MEMAGRQDGESTTPSRAQLRWLARGLDQPGGKLPLFDRRGQRVSDGLVRACLDGGWAEPWFNNPLKPDWLVCRLTDTGRAAAARFRAGAAIKGQAGALDREDNARTGTDSP